MKWEGRRQSSNVEDRRGSGSGKLVFGGIGTFIVAIIIYFLGGDPGSFLSSSSVQSGAASDPASLSAEDKRNGEFASVVLAETEEVWTQQFQQLGLAYKKPVMVLFSDATTSGCGSASAASGPFYCPADEKVYIDLSFADELRNRFKAPGEFALAYVVAHEVGHHVQHLLGTSAKMRQMQARARSEAEANRYSVMLELQADFYAGLWAHHTQRLHNIIEAGDIPAALQAANAIGDDRLQKEAQGYTVPDAFTHGTSQQRIYWFKKGYETGDINQGNTFNAQSL